MISVCIPVYNYEIADLIKSLHALAWNLRPQVEILVIDDGSSQEFREVNRGFQSYADRYEELPMNIGRAAIRNRFTELARFNHLLFLDCDVLPASHRFLQNYLACTGEDIVNGGRIYSEQVPSREYILKWKYGRQVESKSLRDRNNDPYRSFQSSNFMVRKTLLLKYPFEDSIKSYGHEDTLFGFQLMKAGVRIKHIENPVVNIHLENNQTYLKQTEEALHNLADLSALKGFESYVILGRYYRRLSRLNLQAFLRFFPMKLIRKTLVKGYGPVSLFQLFKLLYYARLKRKNRDW